MRKNQVPDFISVSAGDMSLASITGPSSKVNQFDLLSYVFSWSGGQSTNGTLSIEISMDGLSWSALDFGSTVAANTASDEIQLLITEVGFNMARPVYTRTNGSASGTLKIELFASTRGA